MENDCGEFNSRHLHHLINHKNNTETLANKGLTLVFILAVKSQKCPVLSPIVNKWTRYGHVNSLNSAVYFFLV